MSTDAKNLRLVVSAAAGVAAAVQAATALVAIRRGRRDYADAMWGPGLAGIAVASAAVGNGDPRRRWALAVATSDGRRVWSASWPIGSGTARMKTPVTQTSSRVTPYQPWWRRSL